MEKDPRWALLETASANLLQAFAADGVTRIEYIPWFPMSDRLVVWLGTMSDSQRNTLRRVQHLVRVRRALLDAGFRDRDLTDLSTFVQSQETVDRDFEGSCFYAMR